MGVAEIGERRYGVARGEPFGQNGDGSEPPPRPYRRRKRRHFVLELGDDPGGNLGTDAGRARDLPFVLKRNRVGEVRRRERPENRERDLCAHALHLLQRPEPRPLMLGGEAVEPDLVLAHMRVDREGHGLARRRERGKRPGADRHLVAHAARIDDDRAGRDGIEYAGELPDHHAAPSCESAASKRRQEREWAWVMAMASASAASALSKVARGKRQRTMARICVLSPWPLPTTVFFTAVGAYSAIASPESAGTRRAIPRAWPSFSVAAASRLTKVCSMAASTGASSARTRDRPWNICRSLAPRLLVSSETTDPQATKWSLPRSASTTPQPVRLRPGSMPMMRTLRIRRFPLPRTPQPIRPCRRITCGSVPRRGRPRDKISVGNANAQLGVTKSGLDLDAAFRRGKRRLPRPVSVKAPAGIAHHPRLV